MAIPNHDERRRRPLIHSFTIPPGQIRSRRPEPCMRDHDFAPGTIHELDLGTSEAAFPGDRENLPTTKSGVNDPRPGFESKLFL